MGEGKRIEMKVIGSGLIASALGSIRVDGVHFFASGVSDSQELRAEQFQRERHLLSLAIKGAGSGRLVYFSTCSLWDRGSADSPYVQHKLEMESLVSEAPGGVVVRLPSLVGLGGNSRNVVNFFYQKVAAGEALTLQRGATRYLLDSGDMAKVLERALGAGVPPSNPLVIAPKYGISVLEIVETISARLGKSCELYLVHGNSNLQIPGLLLREGLELGDTVGVDLSGRDYGQKVLERYVNARQSKKST